MLINVPDIQTNDDATEELFNSRFATIVSAINGNLDATNLANDAVTAPKIAPGAVTEPKLADDAVIPAKRSGGFKTGQFSTNTTTGNREITGLGFEPKMVKLNCSVGSITNRIYLSTGAMDEDGDMTCAYIGTSGSNPQTRAYTDRCISLIEITGVNPGDTAAGVVAVYVSMDEDGFTIDFTTTKAGYVVNWEAYA